LFGTAACRHPVWRFFTVPSAKEARQVGDVGDRLDRAHFYLLTFIILVLHGRVDHLSCARSHRSRPPTQRAMGACWRRQTWPHPRSPMPVRTATSSSASIVRRWRSRPMPRGGGGPFDVVGPSAVSHDLYATVIKAGKVDGASELRVSKATTSRWHPSR